MTSLATQRGVSLEDEQDLVFIGFLAFLDPPKQTARQAVQELRDKSLELKILTGDAVAVAGKVCSELGMPVRATITGAELDKLSGSDFCTAVRQATVLGKLTPGQKARVVAALKGVGHTVGFLGDGINDALALRHADVGISVDSGSDISKDAADVILLEKSLTVLAHGVARGRLTHGNTIKYIKMAASSNFGNVFSILVASAWLPFQPMRPVQLLTQNLLYDISQIAIPFDKMDASYLAVPRGWAAGSIGWFMVCIGPVSSIFDIATFWVLWFVYAANTPERQALFQTGWFTVGILTQCLIVHMIRTERIPFIQEVAAWPVVLMSLLVSAVGLALQYTPVGRVERFTPLPPSFYGWAAATVLGARSMG
jgi:Mg2+-importing ATPase